MGEEEGTVRGEGLGRGDGGCWETEVEGSI